LLNRLKKEADALEKAIIEIAVYSGGAISWEEGWVMSTQQRNLAIRVINDFNRAKSGKAANEYL